MEQLVGLVLLAGELLLTCGAEMYRVEGTIERMGLAAGFVQVESFATPTGLFISLHTAEGQVYTRVRRIRHSHNNLTTIAEINAMSRSFSAGQITVEEVRQKLERLHQRGAPDTLRRKFIGGGGAMAFTLMYNGTWLEGVIAGIVGSIVLMIVTFLEQHDIPKVLQAVVGSVAAAAMIILASGCLSIQMDVTILGAVMVMAPGVLITTAIRDVFSGELVSGLSRSAEAVAIAVAMAGGVAVVLSLGG